MEDSTCVLQPFSYTSSVVPHESKLGMHGLGDSVSFGRFMMEPLAWEKWSTFSSSSSHNRYVEEAERYAQPGSVAQKKAFFEAHYKRMAAAKKAAADAAAAAAATDDTEAVPAVKNHPAPPTLPPPPPPPAAAIAEVESQGVDSKIEVPGVVETEGEAEMLPRVGLEVKEDSTENSNSVPGSLENQGMVPAGSEEHPRIIEKPLLLEQNCSSEQQAPQLVKSKKKSAFSSLKSSVYRKTPRIPSSPAKQPSITPRKDNSNTSSFNATTPILRKKQQALDFTDKKQNCTPNKSSPVKKLRNLLSPGRRANTRKKTDNASSRIAPDSSTSKTSQNCATLKIENATKLPNPDASMATPCSASKSIKTPMDQSKTTGLKWNMFSAVYSKSLTACRNKLQSPTLPSTPFQLRTEERAARRKQKLEDKFNSKCVEKVQPQQTSLKEKAELELRKLRQSLCFKARPLPDFYKERESQTNQTKKINPVATQPKSPKLGRNPSFRAMQQGAAVSSVPSSTNAENKNCSIHKHFSSGIRKNGRPSGSSYSQSLQEMINHGNASPNTTLSH